MTVSAFMASSAALGLSLAGVVGTALAHSSVLLAAAWLLSQRLRSRPRLEELVWRAGLIGSVLSAAVVSQGLVPPPLDFARFVYTFPSDAGTPLSDQGSRTYPFNAVDLTGEEVSTPIPHAANERSPSWTASSRPDLDGVRFERIVRRASDPGMWLAVVGYVWLVGVLLLLAHEARGWCSLRWIFRDRMVISGPRLRRFDRLRRAAGVPFFVRLSTSLRIRGPVTLPGREVCVPFRFYSDLGPDEQRAVLAHELAHVVRRDPAWASWIRFARVFLFFQPLAHLAERRLGILAEVNSDDWAAIRSSAHSLASSLAVIADWYVAGSSSPFVGATALARETGGLPYRVTRLLDGTHSTSRELGIRTTAGLITVVFALGLALPSLALELGGTVPSSDNDRLQPQFGIPDGASSENVEAVWRLPSLTSSMGDRWQAAAGESARLGGGEVTVRYAVSTDAASAELLSVGFRASATGTGDSVRLETLEVAVGPSPWPSHGHPTLDLGLVQPDSSARWIRDEIAALSRTGSQLELQRRLVEALAAHPGSIAEGYLVRLAWIHPVLAIRRQAVELLSGRPSDHAFHELVLMIQRHPEPSVVEEAVRALSLYEPRRSIPVLEMVITESAEPAVRQTAAELARRLLDER